MDVLKILRDISSGTYQSNGDIQPIFVYGTQVPHDYTLLLDALGGGGSFFSDSANERMEIRFTNFVGKAFVQDYNTAKAILEEYHQGLTSEQIDYEHGLGPKPLPRYAPHPTLPGLLHWGSDITHLTFSWLLDAHGKAVSIVACDEEEQIEFPMTLCEFLHELLLRKLSIEEQFTENATRVSFEKRD